MANAKQTAADFDLSAACSATDAERRRTVHTPGDVHIWVMVLGDLIIFGAYFIIFMVYRAMKPQEFLGVPHLV